MLKLIICSNLWTIPCKFHVFSFPTLVYPNSLTNLNFLISLNIPNNVKFQIFFAHNHSLYFQFIDFQLKIFSMYQSKILPIHLIFYVNTFEIFLISSTSLTVSFLISWFVSKYEEHCLLQSKKGKYFYGLK